MKHTSVTKKARLANGSSRMCDRCTFRFKQSEAVCSVCYQSFNEGYLKGYRQARKDITEP